MGSKSYQVAKPVKHVSGGHYIVAIDNSSTARLLSPDNLAVELAKHDAIRIRFQNHTPATRMRFAFTTDTAPQWDKARSRSIEVVPNDKDSRQYTVNMSGVPGWSGRLKQLRLDLATGKPLTGTVRIDYIRIDSVSVSKAL